MRRSPVLAALALLAAVGACGGDEPAVPFTLILSPEFVQGAIPGARTGVIATIADESPTDGRVTIEAEAGEFEVVVAPAVIAAGEASEITVIVGPEAAADSLVEIRVTATRDGVVQTASRSFTVFDWQDDRAGYARTLLDLFTAWLETDRPDLGITAGTVFDGSFVAPQLLVVSHYLFLSERWEVGLSWHVMIPPDDWAEIYLRPRDRAAPTLAFRLSSQAGALQGGGIVITEVEPPAEVVR